MKKFIFIAFLLFPNLALAQTMAGTTPTSMTAAAPAMVAPMPATMATPAEMAAAAPSMAAKPVSMGPMAQPTMEAAKQPEKPSKTPDKKDGATWKFVIGHALQILLLFVAAIVAALSKQFVSWLGTKMGTDKAAKLEPVFDGIIKMGVHFGEEQSHKLVKSGSNDTTDKMKPVIEFVEKQIKSYGLPEKSAKWIEQRVEAKLGQKREEEKTGKPG